MKNKIVVFMAGVLTGGVFFVLSVYAFMPSLMISVHESRYVTVDETCEQLQKSVELNGWVSPGIRDMNASIAKSGVEMSRKVRLVELCKGTYARDVLTTNPEVSTLMPCAWGVYEGDNGKVYISGMNMGLMGKYSVATSLKSCLCLWPKTKTKC